ncbi:hypothetical protein N0V93_009739 [Gnomoniopsis smithogilvyi]|uniref:Aquaporin n=1 Tax=Gnomoniopsis smithogilvyi TaxID=1191159 RepID=A0A9W8YL37_9PEZI|nr:hypothetical protein N0V93_009739 [Gnomoniopsis smithogilvyi]
MATLGHSERPTELKKHVSYNAANGSSPYNNDLERGPTTLSSNTDTYEQPTSTENGTEGTKESRHNDTVAAIRPSLFNRTFTQNFRAGEGGVDEFGVMDLGSLPETEKGQTGLDLNIKNHIVAAVGEFVGTTMFLFFAFTGTAVATIPAGSGTSGFDIAVQTYIALCFGFSLMVNVWVFYRISGGLFNPAVTLALVLIRAITPIRGVFVFVAQLLGGIAAAGLASCMFPTPLNVSTSLGDGVTLAQGVFIEAVLTFELVFTIFMLAAEKHRATFVAPVGIGLALFIAEMSGVYYTGGSLNPARSLGPCVVAASFPSEHWIYWVGPFFGSLVAFGLYKAIKLLQYETVNPGQDSHE